jgi:hypothetical protein
MASFDNSFGKVANYKQKHQGSISGCETFIYSSPDRFGDRLRLPANESTFLSSVHSTLKMFLLQYKNHIHTAVSFSFDLETFEVMQLVTYLRVRSPARLSHWLDEAPLHHPIPWIRKTTFLATWLCNPTYLSD